MFWSDLAWIAAICTLLGNTTFPVERGAQLVVFGVVLDVTRGHWIHSAVKAPLVWFIVCGLLFEILHLLHKRRTKAMRSMWMHLERLRGHKDMSTLLSLLLKQRHSVTMNARLLENAENM